MSRGWKIFGIIAALIIIPGGIFAGIAIKNLSKIDFKIKGYKIKGIDGQFVYLDFDIDVINPSNIDVHIAGYNIDVFLNDIIVAHLISKERKILKSESTSLLTLLISIDYNKAFGQIKSKEIIGYFISKNHEKIVVHLKGKFKGEILKIPISTKLDFRYSLKEIEELVNPKTL